MTNLVIHSDYMITGVLKVEKHDDCFVFSNPGSLKIPVMDIYAGGHSKARNPNMQAMFRMIGFGDNIGSGFPTILEAWKKENWRQPYLIERSDLHLVELSLSMVSLISEDCRDALHGIFGNNYHAKRNSLSWLWLRRKRVFPIIVCSSSWGGIRWKPARYFIL